MGRNRTKIKTKIGEVFEDGNYSSSIPIFKSINQYDLDLMDYKQTNDNGLNECILGLKAGFGEILDIEHS